MLTVSKSHLVKLGERSNLPQHTVRSFLASESRFGEHEHRFCFVRPKEVSLGVESIQEHRSMVEVPEKLAQEGCDILSQRESATENEREGGRESPRTFALFFGITASLGLRTTQRPPRTNNIAIVVLEVDNIVTYSRAREYMGVYLTWESVSRTCTPTGTELPRHFTR